MDAKAMIAQAKEQARAELPEPSEEQLTLGALQGVYREQLRLRRNADADVCLMTQIARSYLKLPGHVRERLTELDKKALETCAEPYFDVGLWEREKLVREWAATMASDAASAQVLRAVNRYRGRLGYPPLGACGEPEGGESG